MKLDVSVAVGLKQRAQDEKESNFTHRTEMVSSLENNLTCHSR